MESIHGLLIDLDGTVFRGGAIIEGAAEAINLAIKRGKQVVFLSNRGNWSRTACKTRLQEAGIQVHKNNIILSSSVAAAFMKKHYPQCSIWALGGAGLIEEMRFSSIPIADHPSKADWLVVSLHEDVHYEDLNNAFIAVRSGARILATNADKTFPRHDGDAIDVAGMLGAITLSTGRHVDLVVGKPSWLMAEAALDCLKLQSNECLMIGDSLESDIAFGHMFGMKTALVLSGSTTAASAADCLKKPHFILNSIAELHQIL